VSAYRIGYERAVQGHDAANHRPPLQAAAQVPQVAAERRVLSERRRRRLKPASIALALGLLGIPAVPIGLRAESGRSAAAAAAPTARAGALVDLANEQRSRAGLPPLRANSQLMRAAQVQAEQSARARRLAHVLPDARYPRPEDRLEASGYPWRAYAENIAMGHPSASEAIQGWMKSPAHRKNLLSSTYTELGTGYATDDAGRTYYVQVFGRPM
jgi:uncharacterized protein YkwD